jgi:hypothetical protein
MLLSPIPPRIAAPPVTSPTPTGLPNTTAPAIAPTSGSML